MDLSQFINRQRELVQAHSELTSSLYSERTVFLFELLEDPTLVGKLGVPWFNVQILKERLIPALSFLSTVKKGGTVRGIERLPLMFFQRSPIEEDEMSHQEKCFDDPSFSCRWEIQFCGAHPQMCYLHTSSNFSKFMGFDGIIPCGVTFTHEHGAVLGYRMPEILRLMGISPTTASEYLSRIIIHDLGHMVLPSIEIPNEQLHNVVMLKATGAKPSLLGLSRWERLVLRECTDPYFFVDAPAYIKEVSRLMAVKTPEQRLYLKKLLAIYGTEPSPHLRTQIWKIGKKWNRETKKRIDYALRRMHRTHYRAYASKKYRKHKIRYFLYTVLTRILMRWTMQYSRKSEGFLF